MTDDAKKAPAREPLSKETKQFIGVVGALLLLVYLFNSHGMGLLMDRWDSDPNYGHGYLIPFICAYIVWSEKDKLEKLTARVNWFGLVVFIFSLVCVFVAIPMRRAVFAGLSLVLMMNGLLLYLGGARYYKALLLPALYLLFMVPLPQELHTAIANPLQLFVSWVSSGLLNNVLGVGNVRTGVVIQLVGHRLQVAEACSGMRSIMGLGALGVAFAYFWDRPLWERLFLVGSTIPIAITANIIRVTGTSVLYDMGQEQLAQGVYHEFTGWFVFVFALALFMLETVLLRAIFTYDTDEDVKTSSDTAEGVSA